MIDAIDNSMIDGITLVRQFLDCFEFKGVGRRRNAALVFPIPLRVIEPLFAMIDSGLQRRCSRFPSIDAGLGGRVRQRVKKLLNAQQAGRAESYSVDEASDPLLVEFQQFRDTVNSEHGVATVRGFLVTDVEQVTIGTVAARVWAHVRAGGSISTPLTLAADVECVLDQYVERRRLFAEISAMPIGSVEVYDSDPLAALLAALSSCRFEDGRAAQRQPICRRALEVIAKRFRAVVPPSSISSLPRPWIDSFDKAFGGQIGHGMQKYRTDALAEEAAWLMLLGAHAGKKHFDLVEDTAKARHMSADAVRKHYKRLGPSRRKTRKIVP